MSLKTPFITALALVVVAFPRQSGAQLQLISNAAPQSVFFGDARRISATFHNPDAQEFRQTVRFEISQTSSATTIPFGTKPWKELRVLPGQTVLESASLDFPPIKARTKFLVTWVSGEKDTIGHTEVLVYPNNLLDELKLLVKDGQNNLGVLDPHQQLTPALREAGIKFINLEQMELDAYHGKLALIGSCQPNDPEWPGLTQRISKLARNGTPVVWMQLPPPTPDKIWPSFFTVPENTNTVLMVDPALVANLPDNPQAQLDLIYFCRLALHPQPLTLPELTANP
jgi:hypothetical protein